MATKLINNPLNRIFCFGCSFTQYLWTTWANILGTEFHEAEFYNFGKIWCWQSLYLQFINAG